VACCTEIPRDQPKKSSRDRLKPNGKEETRVDSKTATVERSEMEMAERKDAQVSRTGERNGGSSRLWEMELVTNGVARKRRKEGCMQR